MGKKLLLSLLLAVALAAQTAPPAVDAIMQLLEGGMSEALVIKTVQSQGQAYQLTPAEMLKLQQAGASEALISAMLDPSAGATSPAATAPPAAPAPAPEGPPPEWKVRKRRLAVIPFEWAGVQQWVHYWFGRPHNIGEGIRAMLTARMHQAKNVVLVERAQMDEIQAELALSNSTPIFDLSLTFRLCGGVQRLYS